MLESLRIRQCREFPAAFCTPRKGFKALVSTQQTALNPPLAKRNERGYYSNNLLKTRK
jgi:hypothetical protein